VTSDAPATLRCLGDQDPGALGDAGIPGGSGDDLGQLLDHAELLGTVEGPDRGEDLNPHRGAVTVRRGHRIRVQVVDERGRVVPEQPDSGDLLPAHERGGEVTGQRALVGEGSGDSGHVDHGHGDLLLNVYDDRHSDRGHDAL
jgi:hypothetical protein